MSEAKKLDVILPQSENKLATEIMQFVQELNLQEQRDFMAFIQGARFAKALVTYPLTNL